MVKAGKFVPCLQEQRRQVRPTAPATHGLGDACREPRYRRRRRSRRRHVGTGRDLAVCPLARAHAARRGSDRLRLDRPVHRGRPGVCAPNEPAHAGAGDPDALRVLAGGDAHGGAVNYVAGVKSGCGNLPPCSNKILPQNGQAVSWVDRYEKPAQPKLRGPIGLSEAVKPFLAITVRWWSQRGASFPRRCSTGCRSARPYSRARQ
jgi:hypothetical protein